MYSFFCCRWLHRWVVLYWTLYGQSATMLTSKWDVAERPKSKNTSLFVNVVKLDKYEKTPKDLIGICSVLLSRNLTSACFRVVRRGVLFAVCSLFLSVNSQTLLTDFSDQLFETRSWLAGKKKNKKNRNWCWFKKNNAQCLKITSPLISYDITQWVGDVHSHMYSCTQYSWEGCKTRTSCTTLIRRDATDSSAVVYFCVRLELKVGSHWLTDRAPADPV